MAWVWCLFDVLFWCVCVLKRLCLNCVDYFLWQFRASFVPFVFIYCYVWCVWLVCFDKHINILLLLLLTIYALWCQCVLWVDVLLVCFSVVLLCCVEVFFVWLDAFNICIYVCFSFMLDTNTCVLVCCDDLLMRFKKTLFCLCCRYVLIYIYILIIIII